MSLGYPDVVACLLETLCAFPYRALPMDVLANALDLQLTPPSSYSTESSSSSSPSYAMMYQRVVEYVRQRMMCNKEGEVGRMLLTHFGDRKVVTAISECTGK